MSNVELSILHAPSSKHGYVSSIVVTDQAIVAMGGLSRNPLVLASSDGQHVHRRSTPEYGLRGSAAFDDGVFVVGEFGTMLHSSNAGEEWVEGSDDHSGCLYSAVQVGDQLYASGDNGLLLRMELGSWGTPTVVETGCECRLLRVAHINGALYLLGGDGSLRRRSAEGGAFEVVFEGSAPLTGLVATSKGTLMLSGDGGQLYRATNAAAFEAIETGVHEDFEGVHVWGERVLAHGGGGTLLISDDDGVSFSALKVPDGIGSRTLWCTAAFGEGVVIGGDQGLLLWLRAEGAANPWADREDRFARDYPLDSIFVDGPDGFVGDRLQAFIEHVSPKREEQEDDHEEEYDEDEEDEDEEEDEGHAFEGTDAWKRDAIAKVTGLWSGRTDEYNDVWGCPAPAELKRFEAICAHADRWSTFYELRLDCALMSPRDDQNLFEQLILNDQLNYLGTGLPDAFAGTTCIGSLGNGDTYHLSIPDKEDGEERFVWFWDHEQHCFDDEFSDSLDSLAYLCTLARCDEDELASPDASKAGYEALRGRVKPSWHFSMDERDEDFEAFDTVPEKRRPLFYFWRARWMITLFRHDHGGNPESVRDNFVADFNTVVTEEITQARLEIAKKAVPTALYATWRAYLFDEPELEAYLAVCKEHASRLVRDAGALIEELRGGRKQLGRILDWPKVLEGFRALDMDPRRAEARDAEKQQRLAELARQREAVVEEISNANGDALDAICWREASNGALRSDLYEALLGRPELAEAKAAAMLLWGDGYSRCGQLYRDEEYDACRAIAAHATPALQALLVGNLVAPAERDESEDSPPIRAFSGRQIEVMLHALARANRLDARAIELLRTVLEPQEQPTWQQTLVADVLVAAGDEQSADALHALLKATPAEGGFETRMHFDDEAQVFARALSRLGTKQHADVLVPLALSESLLYTPSAAARALGVLDPTLADEALLAHVVANPNGYNDDIRTADAFVGYGLMAAAQPADKRDAMANALEAAEPMGDDNPVPLAKAYALWLIEPTDARRDAVVAALPPAAEERAYDEEDTIKLRRWIAELCRDLPLDAESAKPLVAFFDHHDAALNAIVEDVLTRFGVAFELPEAKLTWLEASRMDAAELRSILQADVRGGRHQAARALVDHPGTETLSALEGVLAAVMKRAPEQEFADEELLRETVRALAELEHVPVELFDAMLRHSNRDLKDPILRDPPPEPKLADAMRVVAAEKWGWQEGTAREWLEEYG